MHLSAFLPLECFQRNNHQLEQQLHKQTIGTDTDMTSRSKLMMTLLASAALSINSVAAPKEIPDGPPLKGFVPGFKVDYAQPSKAKNYDLSKHPYFTKWVDPESKVISYVLTKRVAPLQWPFYFTNSSFSPDGEYLYFYVAFPPCLHIHLGAVSLNPEKPWIAWYPESAGCGHSAMVAPDSSGVYYFTSHRLCFTSTKGDTKLVGSIPDDYINKRQVYWVSTHLTMSSDGKYFLVDGKIGDDYFISLMDAKTGEFKLLHEFPYCHNHAQFSPVNPKHFLLPRDWACDPSTGKYEFMENRLFIMDTEQTYYRALYPEFWEHHDGDSAHEWWSQDGIVCFVNYVTGVFECNPETLEKRHIWKRPVCHAHSNGDRTLFCADQSPYAWNSRPCEILFYNRLKQEEKHIVTAMPKPSAERGDYHLDPHPHFSPDGRNIVYMTTVLGNVDVAVTPVEQLR